MKNKILFIFLILSLNSTAQDTTFIRNQRKTCQAFWQIFERDSLNFEFQNIVGETTTFQTEIYHVDTAINPLSCGGDMNFDIEPYFIHKNYYNCDSISKIEFIYQHKRIKKIGFYIETYDNT